MINFLENLVEARLLWYLYVGKEKLEYQCGNMFVHNYFTAKNLPSITELAIDPAKHNAIISSIIEAKNRQLPQNFETVVFALAVCAKQNVSQPLRQKAYDSVKLICTTPENFILFNKFCSELSKEREEPKSGWGHGWRRVVKEWYNSKTPMELAKIVTRCNSRFGWKHKDIILLAHVSPPKDEKAVVFDYLLHGLEKMKRESEEKKDRTELEESIVTYFESVEKFKHCEDEDRAAALVEILQLTLDHVPGHMLKSEKVWCSLVSSMSLKDILTHLQRMHNMGFFKSDNLILNKVLDAMDEVNVRNEKISPASVLITLKNYQNSGKPLTFEKRKIRDKAKKKSTSLEPKKEVVERLFKLLDFAFLYTPPTNKRFLVTISSNKKMFETGCWQCSNVKAIEAAAVIALTLLHVEKNVTLAIFVNNGIQCISTKNVSTLSQMLSKLNQTSPDESTLKEPLEWALKESKKFDVFLNITDAITRKNDKTREGLVSYRAKTKHMDNRIINCALCVPETYDKTVVDHNILTICGFDAKIPKLIECISQSYF